MAGRGCQLDKKISGVIAAVPTPFDENDEPVIDLFMEHCHWVLDSGCDGLNVLGSTGEANSQSSRSRAGLMRAVAQSSLADSALMVGTGTPSLHDTIDLTVLAAESGFDAALVLPPYYYKPLSDDGLFNYFSRVIASVSKYDIGVYLYNFPQMCGVTFSTELVARLLGAFPRHMKGMKDSSGDMAYTNNMAATFSDSFDVFPGSEGPLPDAREFGYAGCISASVNATAVLAAKIWRERDAVSTAEVDDLRALRTAIASVPMAAAVKTLVSIRTGRDEWRRMLPPLMELSVEDQQVIEAVADRLGHSR